MNKKNQKEKIKSFFEKNYKILVVFWSILITTATVFFISQAGSLNPTNPPADTFYTLDDIYHKLDKDAGPPASYGIDSSADPTPTMHTLSDIYDKAPSYLTNPATQDDVCNSKTFYANSAELITGRRSTNYNGTGTNYCYPCYP